MSKSLDPLLLIHEVLRKINNDDRLYVTQYELKAINGTMNVKKANCKVISKGRETKHYFVVKKIVNHTKELQQRKLLSRIETNLKEISDDVFPLTPIVFEYGSEKCPFNVMEDLQNLKFINLSSSEMELGSCLQFLNVLAAYHALTMKLLIEEETLRNEINTLDVRAKNSDLLHKINMSVIMRLTGISVDLRKLKTLNENKVPNNKFSVIRNINLTPPNIMRRYRGCGLWDFRLLSMDASEICPPVVDLIYFLLNFPKWENCFRDLQGMLDHYYSRLKLYLTLSKTPIEITFEEICSDLQDNLLHFFLLFCAMSSAYDKNYFIEGIEFFKNKGLFD